MEPTSIQEPIRIAFVTDLLGVGGAESQIVDLVHALDPSRIQPEVIVLRDEGALFPRLRVPSEALGMPGPAALPALASRLQKGRFRAVYTTHGWSIILAAFLRIFLRPPRPQRRVAVIDSEHSYMTPLASPALEPVRRFAARRADCIVAVSEAQAQWLRAYLGGPPRRIEVVPNALDPADFESVSEGEKVRAEFGIPSDAPLILCVARLVKGKGHDVLLSAVEGLDVHLLLVGDGPERGTLEKTAQCPSLAGRVHFAGTRPDTRPFLSAASVACLASRSESQGIVLVEAMAAGLPVVASRVGGIPEVVEEGVTGHLVPPDDSVALAHALLEAMGDPAWRRRAGEAGRERVKRMFSIQDRARKIENLIVTLVQDARRW